MNVDNDGDYLTDVAFSWVFNPPEADGSQTYSVFMATGAESRKPEAVGTTIVSGAAVSFGPPGQRGQQRRLQDRRRQPQ
jgi:hypothetical protein